MLCFHRKAGRCPNTVLHYSTCLMEEVCCITVHDLDPHLCSVVEGTCIQGGGPRVVVSTAAFHARVRGSVPGLGGLKETKMFLPHPRVKVSIVGSLRDREVACSASDRQGSNFESCVWRTVSSQSSHHPQEVLLAQFSLYVHKGGLKPDSFHFFLHVFSLCSSGLWPLTSHTSTTYPTTIYAVLTTSDRSSRWWLLWSCWAIHRLIRVLKLQLLIWILTIHPIISPVCLVTLCHI